MTNNIYPLLAAYFRYQRDMGAVDIAFESGAVKKMVSGGTVEKKAVAVGVPPRDNVSAQPQTRKWTAPASAGRHGAVNDVSAVAAGTPLSKLSKIKTVDAIGIPKFERKPVAAGNQSAKREKLAELYRETVNCDRCLLSKGRGRVVFGSGSAEGRLFVIGDAPSVDDDCAGLPFQGGEGEIFDRMLGKMGLSRKGDVFATYIQKCRHDEFVPGHGETCRSLLDKQIDIIEPRVLLVFGLPAANFLLGGDDGIERLRGVDHTYKGRPVVVTYGLSLMLKEERYRFGAWEDLKRTVNMVNY
jgi:DNA polymerase